MRLDQSSVKEQVRSERAGIVLELWTKDLVHAWRGVRREPGSSGLVVAVISLGIAAATTVFTLANAVLFKTIAVDRPEQLRQVSWTSPDLSFSGPSNERFWRAQVTAGRTITAFSYRAYEMLRDGVGDVASLACTDTTARVAGTSGVFTAQLVTGSYFDTVGIPMALGRGITLADDRQGVEPVAVVSFGLWRREFGGRPETLDRSISIRGRGVRVVGVMAEGFGGLDPANPRDVLLPYSARALLTPIPLEPAAWGRCALVARLRTDASEDQLRARLAVVLRRAILDQAPPQWDAPVQVNLAGLARGFDTLRDVTARPLLLIGGAIALLLLIACINVAGLLLARAATQEAEVATRSALGASRTRLVRFRLFESLLLASLAGAVGAALSFAAEPLIPSLLSRLGEIPGGPAPSRLGTVVVDLTPDARVLLFVIGVVSLCGLAFGIGPALRAARIDLTTAVRRGTVGQRVTRWRTGSVVVLAQVALAMTLAVMATLLSRDLARLEAMPTGFEPSRVLYVSINDVQAAGGVDEAVQRFANVPGVVAASASQWPLFSDADQSTLVCVGGTGVAEALVDSDRVTPGFFDSWGVRIQAGRDFSPLETQAAIVNETFARRFLRGRGVGEVIGLARAPLSRFDGTCPGTPLTIVGIVADHRHSPRSAVTPMVYVPYGLLGPVEPTTLALRTSSDPRAVVPAVRRVVTELPTAVGGDVTTGLEYRNLTLSQMQLLRGLFLAFGSAAILLAALGVYGLLSHHVRRRIPEFGIRLALGAGWSDLVRTALQPSIVPVAAGVIGGAAVAFALRRLVEPWLSSVASSDLTSYMTAAAVFVLVALLATVGPAIRAIRLQVVEALRTE